MKAYVRETLYWCPLLLVGQQFSSQSALFKVLHLLRELKAERLGIDPLDNPYAQTKQLSVSSLTSAARTGCTFVPSNEMLLMSIRQTSVPKDVTPKPDDTSCLVRIDSRGTI
jgi:hypothetical protein